MRIMPVVDELDVFGCEFEAAHFVCLLNPLKQPIVCFGPSRWVNTTELILNESI